MWRLPLEKRGQKYHFWAIFSCIQKRSKTFEFSIFNPKNRIRAENCIVGEVFKNFEFFSMGYRLFLIRGFRFWSVRPHLNNFSRFFALFRKNSFLKPVYFHPKTDLLIELVTLYNILQMPGHPHIQSENSFLNHTKKNSLFFFSGLVFNYKIMICTV